MEAVAASPFNGKADLPDITSSLQMKIDELEDFMDEDTAEQTLRAIISLARYAEAFSYDDATAMFSLDNPA